MIAIFVCFVEYLLIYEKNNAIVKHINDGLGVVYKIFLMRRYIYKKMIIGYEHFTYYPASGAADLVRNNNYLKLLNNLFFNSKVDL